MRNNVLMLLPVSPACRVNERHPILNTHSTLSKEHNPMQNTLPLLCALLFAGALSGPAARAADYTNSIGMKFKDIPAGRFYMGSCRLSGADSEANKKRKFMGLPAATCPSGAGVDDQAANKETPQHEVRIGRGFRMGMHEVTLGQFKQYIAAAGRDDLLTDDFIQSNSSGDRAAVVWVSRDDARGFIGWLNKKEGTQAYRLPSEAEWEYAARAGTTTRYSWGNAIGRNRANCDGCGSRWDNKHPAPVGSFAPNAFGLYDMHGNVLEWVADCWHDNYEGAPTDGSAWTTGCDNARAVLRGGSWSDNPRYLRAANRDWITPSYRFINDGFRLVQDLNP